MPILPENRCRYPADWKAISERIRFERAGGRCECERECGIHDGRCDAEHGEVGYWIEPGRFYAIGPDEVEVRELADGEKLTRIVLTVAHLDHQPENCEDGNLKAMCQRCHNRYDQSHRYETRRKGRVVRDMWED